MALEAVVFPRDFLDCKMKKCSYNYDPSAQSQEKTIDGSASCSSNVKIRDYAEMSGQAAVVESGNRKRRRVKGVKNKEEVENQRMTHIAVERNRRRLMNVYLAILRSLMPASYAQRGDQASIVGGAINFVKELEQQVQSLEASKRTKDGITDSPPFSDFFKFPQYTCINRQLVAPNNGSTSDSVADIEVTMVESHANVRVLSRRRPKQLVKMLMGLQSLRLTTLHLNLTTTVDQMVLYCFSLKVEDDSLLSSVDDIATAMHQMIRMIDKECSCT
ncbi:basic helix-loop-helix (bHLH) DNA-binding superfamily protein [Rhynchospora pubera]|uniref:Basic helix-loop-helix (BHLH) DNA-binding superfamily protein n=1 Tax=Rhynchospora pubera TaxID=906938 RepID=A0AAV8HA34_9POAL|nr:basic helix-loop-helix (bHLH) DNA-binding superfamily protein [Rhynchospora pubera]